MQSINNYSHVSQEQLKSMSRISSGSTSMVQHSLLETTKQQSPLICFRSQSLARSFCENKLIRKYRISVLSMKKSRLFTIYHKFSEIPVLHDVNGKRFFGLSHWKILRTNFRNSEKVVPFFRLGRSEWKFVYH